jgi:ADP-ribose pyrophosphatase
VDEEGGVYLTRQFRYGIGRESVEAASGGLGEGEPPLEAAKRELKEELGIQAGEWVALGAVDVDPAKMDSRTHLFLAKGLTFSRTEREPTEDISTVKISLREAADQVMAGEITHASSCVLILKAQRLLSTDQPPDGQSGGEEAPGGLIGCDERCDPGDFDGRRAVLSDGTGYPPRI